MSKVGKNWKDQVGSDEETVHHPWIVGQEKETLPVQKDLEMYTKGFIAHLLVNFAKTPCAMADR